VHQKILRRLEQGDWVSTDELLNLTNQKYLDRRIRELRDEDGWQIVHEMKGNQHGYRLASFEKGEGRKRHYLAMKEKVRIFERDGYRCQICECGVSKANAQIDHRIPLIKGGDMAESNLQTLCLECNVVKRGHCRRCTLESCQQCFLANPGLIKNRVVLQLPSNLYSKLKSNAERSGKLMPLYITELLSEAASNDV
jgi:hypothetical protein